MLYEVITVSQINRFAVVHVDHNVLHIFKRLKKPPGVNDNLPRTRWITAGIGRLVGRCHDGGHPSSIQAVSFV